LIEKSKSQTVSGKRVKNTCIYYERESQKNVLDFCPRHFLLCKSWNLHLPLCRVMSPRANNLLWSRPLPVAGGGRRERGRGQNIVTELAKSRDILGTSTRKVVASKRPLHPRQNKLRLFRFFMQKISHLLHCSSFS